MPWPAISGMQVSLNLGARLSSPTNRLPLNLGVDADGPAPPDPTIVGGLTSGQFMRWGHGSQRQRALNAQWGGAVIAVVGWGVAWGGSASWNSSVRAPWGTPAQQAARTLIAWDQMEAQARSVMVPWGSPPTLSGKAQMLWASGIVLVSLPLQAAWAAPPQLGRSTAIRWGRGDAAHVLLRSRWNAPPKIHPHWRIPWGRGDGLDWIVRPAPPVPPDPPGPSPFPDGRYVGLNLGCPVFTGDTRRVPLNLGITACWNARSQQKAYIVLNQISVVRLPDRLPIDVDAVSLVGAREAWAWNANLALANPAQLALLAPTISGPRSVEITINGYAWVIAIEAYDKGEVFGATAVSLTGRSVTAQLSEPYAAPRTREVTAVRTMVQLAESEATGSGVTIDYDTVDWLVPAGAWYYEGLSPMSALMRLAEASGGVVQSHPTDPVLQLRPRYPVSPWLWTTTTPDVVIQDDIVSGTRLQLQSKPLFDAVIVAGERVGVTARVRRDGEAGTTYAPQQIDQLIVHADGARERGRNVLSDRGGQATIDHDLPLFGGTLQPGQPGLVLPLMLAQRQTPAGTWHGLVTGVRIDARRQDKAIDIVQTVTIERHYTDAD